MQLMELTRQGYAVELYEENSPCTNGQAKESITYVTSNASDAAHWSMRQAKEGNKVSITYDEVNHVYICISTSRNNTNDFIVAPADSCFRD